MNFKNSAFHNWSSLIASEVITRRCGAIQDGEGTELLPTVKLLILFHFLMDHWVHLGIFENGVLLMYTLEGVSSVANFFTVYGESK